MRMKTVDARGLACPKPVLETKKALESLTKDYLVTIVDNQIALENLKKLATKLAYDFEVMEDGEDLKIKIYGNQSEKANAATEADDYKLLDKSILFTSNKMGKGDDALGQILTKGYIYTLSELDAYPKYLMFVNSGVKLTTKGSESIEDLKRLEEKGVEILSCGTCLDYLGFNADDLAVGSVTNMYSIVDNTLNVKNTLTIG